jgi:L-iditol 2-dehydrogenase
MTDIDDGRLALAKELGADHTLNVKGKSAAQLKEEIHSRLGQPPQVSMECTGVASSIETAILSTISGGTIVLVGLGADRVELPMVEAAIREVDIRGIFRYANCYPTAIELVASKKVDLSRLSRAHYTLEETPEAFKRAQKADVIKVFIHCEKKD